MIRKIATRGRDNLALTVMMPEPCQAKCSFCTVRELYNHYPSDPGKLWRQFERLVKYDAWPAEHLKPTDIVFSGGEPMYSPQLLKNMVELAKAHGYKTYVNTVLPSMGTPTWCWSDTLALAQQVDGFNISRHGGQWREDLQIRIGLSLYTDERVAELAQHTAVRINAMAKPNGPAGLLTQAQVYSYRWERFLLGGSQIELNIRMDYEKVAANNKRPGLCKLPSLLQHDDVMPLLQSDEFTFYDRTCCAVCETLHFEKSHSNFKVRVHQGSKLSHRDTGIGQIEVNDLILMHTGNLCYDWGMEYLIDQSDTKDRRYTGISKELGAEQSVTLEAMYKALAAVALDFTQAGPIEITAGDIADWILAPQSQDRKKEPPKGACGQACGGPSTYTIGKSCGTPYSSSCGGGGCCGDRGACG